MFDRTGTYYVPKPVRLGTPNLSVKVFWGLFPRPFPAGFDCIPHTIYAPGPNHNFIAPTPPLIRGTQTSAPTPARTRKRPRQSLPNTPLSAPQPKLPAPAPATRKTPERQSSRALTTRSIVPVTHQDNRAGKTTT